MYTSLVKLVKFYLYFSVRKPEPTYENSLTKRTPIERTPRREGRTFKTHENVDIIPEVQLSQLKKRLAFK
jgi:hypothetical protein